MRSEIKERKNKNKIKKERKQIMKTTRKILTLALALILTLALAVPAMAADPEGGTIKVTGSSNTVYSVYKMFTVEDGNDVDKKENLYRVDSAWEAFVLQTGMDTYFELQDTNDGYYVIWIKDTTNVVDAAAIAELARTYVEKPENTSVKTASYKGDVAVGSTLDVNEDGYYLLVPNNKTASGVVAVKKGAVKEINEKSVAPGMPTIEKAVYEDALTAYTNANSVDVGGEIMYRITITAGVGASEYILHDKMDEHIKFVDGSIAITRGGNTVKDSEYTVENKDKILQKNYECGCTFHIVFDPTWCAGLNEGAKIVVTYKGQLIGEDQGDGTWSEVETDTAHENIAWMTHTATAIKTNPVAVETYTYEVNVVKQDQNNKPLEGAGFVLRDNEDNYYKYENGIVSWVTDIEQATEYFSDENGKLRFYGVDAEIFSVEEKTVPNGYTGVKLTTANTKTGNVNDGDLIVVNVLGTALPETGGIGTTVFYIGGVALVLCALVALVVIKRKETIVQ